MRKKVFSIMFAMVLALSLSLIPAVPVAAANPTTIASSTMVFESAGGYTLTYDSGTGTYSGMIPMVAGVGFDIYAEEGATAAFSDDPNVTISNHDAWPGWDPDTPDWYQYSLRLYNEGGVQKWRVANHSGANAPNDPWYDNSDGDAQLVEQGVPMSGVMYWTGMYAAETDVGEYLPPIDPATHPKHPYWARANGGGPACWDMDWSWGSEVVPLQHPGFDVVISDLGSGDYRVILTPALGPVTNLNTGVTYGTIQLAVDDASPGNTISASEGTYPENVVIGKANLTLLSEAPLGAIIRPAAVSGWPNAPIYISADGVTIDGFEIDGTTVANNGIYGWDTSGLTIKNNKIHGAVNAWDGCGILLLSWGNSGTVYDNLIQDNEVYDTGRMGIMVMDHGAEYTVTSGNTITGNTVYDVWKVAWGDHGGGIQINVGKNCAITNNEVYDVRNGQRGIYMFGSAAGNTITGNTLRNNPIGIQIWISGELGTTIDWGGETATSPEVHYNEIYGNTMGAISTNEVGATPMVLEATLNWWGDVTGPNDPLDADGLNQLNPTGLGNGVTEYVRYYPWIGQGGMVTGGGWINSPAGAYTPDTNLTGKATFGFVSKYKKGAEVPTGNTEFNFRVADLKFHSDSYDWLVITGSNKAMFKGTGTINSAGNYGFMLSAIDGDPDMFRIKIWDKATDCVIYDNGCSGPDGTEIGGGQIVVHKK